MKHLLTLLLLVISSQAQFLPPWYSHGSPANTLTNGLFAVWHLDETGDNVRNDSWGTSHLYVSNTAKTDSATGVLTNCLTLEAAGTMTNNANGMTFTTFTISFWYYPSNVASSSLLFETKTNLSSGTIWSVFSGSANNLRIGIGSSLYAFSGVSLNNSLWHHIVIVSSNSVPRAWLYQSGILVSSVSTATLPSDPPGTFCIARQFAAGAYDEVAIWSRGLEPAEIAELYRYSRFTEYPISKAVPKIDVR